MKVLVLAGGKSEEKSISIASGRAVYQAIKRLPEWDAVLVDPAAESWQQIECDIVFPVLHGAGGEDGILQKVLEHSRRLFVGSRSKACELTFDKAACSRVLKELGIPCPAEIMIVSQSEERDWHSLFDRLRADSLDSDLWVVKPNQQGSSVGISVVSENSLVFRTELSSAIRRALQFDQTCLIQQYIRGREITVSMLDGIALSPIEVSVASGFYDFHAKYESAQTIYEVVDDRSAQLCVEVAKQVHGYCGTAGIIRIDFRVDENGRPWFLEVNTIPGMTERSLVPMSAADRGWSLGELCRRAVMNAFNRPVQDTSAS